MQDAQDSPAAPAPCPTAYVEAYACDDFGDGPSFVAIEVTDTFKALLRSMTALLYSHDLSMVEPQGGPCANWGPEELADQLRMEWPDLHIMRACNGKADFYFRAHPKHADYACETRAQDVEEFIAAVERGELYFGTDPANIKEQAEEEQVEKEGSSA